jgi:hypothetical protein
MVCALSAPSTETFSLGDIDTPAETAFTGDWFLGDTPAANEAMPRPADERADAKDPFDDFEEDDFDDDFDDDFEEDWEDDLTEDDEFPDTFGGADEPDEEEVAEPDAAEESPFADDPDFDEA